MAFLPPDLIADEFVRQRRVMKPEIRVKLDTTLDYIDSYWLKIVKPAAFSVYGLKQRTNNISESENAHFIDDFGIRPVPCDALRNTFSRKIDIHLIYYLLRVFLFVCFDSLNGAEYFVIT